MLAMRRYVEATRFFWCHVITKVKIQNGKTLDPLFKLQRTEIRSYREVRRNFESSQSKYDTLLSRYAALSKSKEPSAIREDAFALAEAKKAYIKASFDLACIIHSVERQINTVLIDTMADPWLLRRESLAPNNPRYHQIGVDMYRIKSWSRIIGGPLKSLETEMLKVRHELEQQTVDKTVPSRDLRDYTAQSATISHLVLDIKNINNMPTEKHGWLFVKTSAKAGRQVWVRRWAFVRDGLFGWLVLAPNKLFVQESDKVGVLLCNVSPEPKEDRRFCFEIRTKDTNLVLQAESLADLKAWLQVFELSKRKVLESDRHCENTRAFNKLYPFIQEFAASAQTSVDTELTHEQALPTSDSLATPESCNIQALMTSGNKLLSSISEFSDDFSSLGPFGCGLVSKTLLNVPMPTSMTKEALVANSVVKFTNIPTAITANYWGSVNWAMYQKNSSLQEDIDRANQTNIVSQPRECYPSWYPVELQSQDTQMRAIFQGLADPDPEDRVVLHFRCLFRPSPKQELPCRTYITPKYLYSYSIGFGLIAIIKRPLVSLTSVEGRYAREYDTLYIINEDGSTATVKLFLDSGKLVRRRMQFLIDNAFADEPLKLKEIIEKLTAIGEERRRRLQQQLKEATTFPNLGNISEDEDYDEEFGATSKEILERYLVGAGHTRERSLEGGPSLGVEAGLVDSGNLSTMAAMSMAVARSGVDSLLTEEEFDIPSKALFHLMFGEKSKVFMEEKTSSLLKKEDLRITPWHLVDSVKRERELTYLVSSQGVLRGSRRIKDERVTQLQRIEKKEENRLYVVYDRKPVWELPQGAMFYIATRYIIANTAKSRTKCKLYIYCSAEWLKPAIGPLRRSVESIINSHNLTDATQLVNRIRRERKKLGDRGMSVTAIRIFGKLGTAVHHHDDDLDDNEKVDVDSSQEPTIITHSSFASIYAAQYVEKVLRLLRFCLILSLRIFALILSQFTVHRMLLAMLCLSGLFNFVLLTKSTLSYWTERRAENMLWSLNVVPSSKTVMTRSLYLGEINDMIRSGQGITFDTDGLCYQKFKDLAYSEAFDDFERDSVIGTALDDKSIAIAQDINRLRNGFGVRRNELLVNLRVLNTVEKESIIGEWKRFLLQELNYCSMMSRTMNSSGPINDYCSNCLDDWRRLSET